MGGDLGQLSRSVITALEHSLRVINASQCASSPLRRPLDLEIELDQIDSARRARLAPAIVWCIEYTLESRNVFSNTQKNEVYRYNLLRQRSSGPIGPKIRINR